jgi:hypothetical protein
MLSCSGVRVEVLDLPERLVRQSLDHRGHRVMSAAHHDQMFRMKLCAADRDGKRDAEKAREPHWLQRKPASASVRLSPSTARKSSRLSRARRMQ